MNSPAGMLTISAPSRGLTHTWPGSTIGGGGGMRVGVALDNSGSVGGGFVAVDEGRGVDVALGAIVG